MKGNGKKYENVAIYVDSDFQLMSAIKFSLRKEYGNNVDLFISGEIAEVEGKAKKLEQNLVFRKVYQVRAVRYDKNKYKRKLKSIISTINKSSFSRYLDQKDIEEIRARHYQLILMSCASLSCEMFRNFVSHDELGYIDDGYGSYFFDIYTATIGKMRQTITRLLRRKERPLYLFVNNKSNCFSTTTNEILDLGEVNDEILSICKALYGKDGADSIYKNDDVVYLTQPMNGGKTVSETEDRVIQCINEAFGDRLIIRDHPRTEMRKDSYRHDTQRALWEYVCFNSIVDSNILISMGSTAQITPRLISGKQPCLIFLYMLYVSDESSIERFQYSYDKIRQMYDCPEKVIAPRNIDELKQVLLKLKMNV